MARFRVNSYYDFATKGYPTGATWEAAKDKDFNDIIDRTINDPNNIFTWNSPLEYDDGKHAYADLDEVYARVKFHIDDDVSDWYYMGPANQNDQEVIFTRDGKVIRRVNSLEINF